MKISKSIWIWSILMILITGVVLAYPSLPTEFYGRITSFNANVSGGVVQAYVGNVSCGTFSIVNSGFYGVLSCLGKDTENINSSGGLSGSNITFTYNGMPTTTRGDATFNLGVFKFVNITHPVVVCGDFFCDALEDCSSCSFDCGPCNSTGGSNGNSTGNQTGNQTTGSGSGSGSSGGGGGGGGGGAGGGGGGGGQFGATPSFPPCTERWACGNWTDCSLIGVQLRNCTDSSHCGTYDTKPKEVQDCAYEGNCFDSIINCHNGKCEEGVDCGGPCDTKCPSVEQPIGNITIKFPKLELPKKVCERHVDFKDESIWIFLLIVLLSLIIRYVYTSYKIYLWREDDTLAPLDRARRINSAKRKNLLFAMTLFFLTLVSFLYSYYFLLCPTDFLNYSWLLIILLLLIPLVIHTIMRKFEYSSGEHLDKSRKLDDIHYQNIVRMIEMENDILADEENAIANRLYELSKKRDFSELMEKNAALKDIYKNLVKLYTEYREKKNPFGLEKDVVDDIDVLENDALFKKEIENHAELKHLYERLKKLYSQYEEKQKLYDKLDETEEKEGSEKKKDKK